MKKTLSLIMAGLLTAAMTLSAAAVDTLPENLQGKIGFGIQKATTTWVVDGVKSAGEYYDVAYSADWCVGVCSDAAASDTAQNLPVDLAMSWDEEYVYVWMSYTEATGHKFTAADHPAFWDGEIVQLGFADMDVTPGEASDRLETGYGQYSDSGEKTTINWSTPLDAVISGYAADNGATDDFECIVDGNTVTYEIRVPVAAFTNNKAAEGYEFKFCPVICYDGGAGSYYMWSLGDGITGGPKDAYQHVNVKMEAAPVVETAPEVVEDVIAAPQTFDAAIIAAVAAIVSAAGYAVSKKR